MPRVHESRGAEAGRFALILLFIGLPLALAWFGVRQIDRERKVERKEQIERRLEDALASYERYGNTDQVVERLLLLLEKKAFAGPGAEGRLRRLIPRFHRALPGVFSFTVLDGEGRQRTDLSEGQAPKTVLRRIFQAAVADQAGDSSLWERDETMIRGYFGPLAALKRFAPSRLLPAAAVNHHRFVFMTRAYPEGMVIVRVSQRSDWNGLGYRLHHARCRYAKGLKVALIDRRGGIMRPFAGWQATPGRLRQVARAFQADLQRKSWIGRERWEGKVLSSRWSLVGRALLPSEKRLRERVQQVFTVGILAWLVLSCIVWYQTRPAAAVHLPVRLALTFAFLYAAGIPLFALGITARFWLNERRQVLEDDLHRRTGKALIAFDGRFEQRLTDYSTLLTQILQRVTITERETERTLSARLAPARKAVTWDLCRIVDPDGRIRFEEVRREAAGRIAGAFDNINSGMVRLMSLIRRKPSGQGIPAGAAPVKSVSMQDPEMERLYSLILPNLGVISPIDISRSMFFNYIYPLFDAAGECRSLLLISWTQEGMQSEFLRQELLAFGRQLESADLYAWCGDRPDDSQPQSFRYAERLAPLLPRVQARDRETRQRFEEDGEPRLVTGIRGSFLDRFTLVAVSDDRMIRAELRAMVWGLGGGAALLLVISVTAGMLIARGFLVPIGHLERGVNALAAQRFGERVPVVSSDEFGHLSSAFNQMMEGLADLEVARTVQDALFPGQALGLGTWEVYGRCVSASRIGGDYFDYIPLDERRLGIVIGDVSGHGVSAALVMAMAKALIADSAGKLDPARILAVLNAVFERVLQGQKTMSCLVGILDVVEDKLTICNGGHCFPYLVRNDRAEQLELPGMLIGMGKRWRQPAVREISLQPGDCLVAFSDALYEARDRSSGKPIGFSRLQTALPGLVGACAQGTEGAVRNWHAAIAGGPQEVDDDLTVVVVQRRLQEERR